jgi:hypothetical protein
MIQTCNICFIRYDSQLIELPLEDKTNHALVDWFKFSSSHLKARFWLHIQKHGVIIVSFLLRRNGTIHSITVANGYYNNQLCLVKQISLFQITLPFACMKIYIPSLCPLTTVAASNFMCQALQVILITC